MELRPRLARGGVGPTGREPLANRRDINSPGHIPWIPHAVPDVDSRCAMPLRHEVQDHRLVVLLVTQARNLAISTGCHLTGLTSDEPLLITCSCDPFSDLLRLIGR